MLNEKLVNVIDALSQHKDVSSVLVLEEIGTDSSNDEVRELTAKALVRKNIEESLKVVIVKPGKGINDLNSNVAMSTINEILALKDKSIVNNVLEDTICHNSNEEIRDTARSLKALISLSN